MWRLRFGGRRQARRTLRVLRTMVHGRGVYLTLKAVRNDPYWDGGA